MNQQLWSGLATTAFLLASLSVPSASSAQQSQSQDDIPDANVSLESEIPELNQPVSSADRLTADSASSTEADAVKVGEYQSQDEPEAAAETIAQIQPHEMQGRSAATVYVRDIPVLTFLGTSSNEIASADPEVKVATPDEPAGGVVPTAAPTPAAQSNDPTWRATTIAARLNQLHHDRVDASAITVNWNGDRQNYVIQVNNEELVEINADTILPDTTRDPANDALQAANRLRRLLGNAPPLEEIIGRPQPQLEPESPNIVQRTIRGIASWYGPGFNGRRSASGEIFNQNALTAAHRSLPFGTQVRVTNLRTGQSVVVRINDRGPFSGRRIIDLSAAAARAVGLMQSGVAPVSIDVLDTPVVNRRSR
ncbi:septal ring lytic transglycosylase RlpA family protein [Microcoleus sp. FACHB-1515]|uniref:septal ring lytic transglycosylase RlpA family protein n=1 Tax=Cyanophyceae TaxID=3028117 RepID=UPI001686B4D1|nr:septal ring lytic transglycosylase RlpA family protein [Microcoleus sp. FACHB-1515]MBD2090803.1 septal ring lytic transglycosylase RlpA family protein [Microcoleus sp. FACHB-1515]